MHILTLRIVFLGPLIELKTKVMCKYVMMTITIYIQQYLSDFIHEFHVSTGSLCYNKKNEQIHA